MPLTARRLSCSRSLPALLLFFCTTLASLPGMAAQPTRSGTQPAATASDKPGMVIAGLGKAVAPLDGPWQFHLGDDPRWASPSFDDSGWEQLTAQESWGRQGHPSYTGYAWYRLHLTIRSAPTDPNDFVLLVPHLDDIYEIFWNGQSIGRSGTFPPHPVWFASSDAPAVYALTRPLLQGTPSRQPGDPLQATLAIRVWKAPLYSDDSGLSGGFEGAPSLGYPEAAADYKTTLDYQWLRNQQFAFNEYLLYAIVGLLSFFSWLRDRKQKTLLWMTGFALAPVLRLFLYGMRLPWTVGLSNALGPPISSIRDISLWFLLLWLLHLDEKPFLIRLTRRAALLSISVTVLDGLLSLLDASVSWFGLIQIADAVLTGIYFITAAMPLVLVGFAFQQRHRLDLSRRLLAVTAFFSGMIQVVQVLAPQGSRFTHWTLAQILSKPLFRIYGNAVSLPTLTGTLLLLAVVYAVYRSAAEDRSRRGLLELEMKGARELQQFLIPAIVPSVPGYALTSAYRPALEVGGDFFQIVPLDSDCTLVLLGDVSGKGIKAAMAVSLILGLVRVLVETMHSPALLMAELNRQLFGRLQSGFATCVALRIDPNGDCALASAGHPSPYLNDRELDLSGSFPLGLFPDILYEETHIRLHVGDHLALYTDGLLEARSKTGELYGFERIRELFATSPDAAKATEAAVLFGQDDDITVVTLVRVPLGEESTEISAANLSA